MGTNTTFEYFYPANLEHKFEDSWKKGKYVYFVIGNKTVKLLDILRPSQVFSPTSLKFKYSSTLSSALRTLMNSSIPFKSLKTFQQAKTGQYFYLESPYLKSKKGSFSNINYYDIKSFYYTIHNQLVPYYDFSNTKANLENLTKETIPLKKYVKWGKGQNSRSYHTKTGYDLRENVSDFFVEKEYKKDEIKGVTKFIDDIVALNYTDKFDKTLLKKSRNLLSFGCFVQYDKRSSRMTPLHSFIPLVARKIMDEFNKLIKSFYGDTDCSMVKHVSLSHAERMLQLAVKRVNKQLFGFDLLVPEEFKLDTKGEFKRMHIFDNKFYIYEKADDTFSYTFAGIPTPKHSPITSLVARCSGGWKSEHKFLKRAIEPSLGNTFDFESFFNKLPTSPLIALRYYYLSQDKTESNFMKDNPHLCLPLGYSSRELFSRFQT